MKVGAYARSQIGTGDSSATCEETVCDGCSVSLSDVAVAGSDALSEATGNAWFLCSSCVFEGCCCA